MQIVERLDEVLRAAAPAAQLRDEDGVDLVGSGNARTLARSGRALSAPDAVSLKTATILSPARLANARKSLSWHSQD